MRDLGKNNVLFEGMSHCGMTGVGIGLAERPRTDFIAPLIVGQSDRGQGGPGPGCIVQHRLKTV